MVSWLGGWLLLFLHKPGEMAFSEEKQPDGDLCEKRNSTLSERVRESFKVEVPFLLVLDLDFSLLSELIVSFCDWFRIDHITFRLTQIPSDWIGYRY